MNRFFALALAIFCFAGARISVAQESLDHVEVGAFAEYFRFDQTSPTRNFFGLGGRVGVNVHKNIQLEAEMGYDFKRDFTNVYDNGINSETVTSRLRTIHGLFGPKFQTSAGPFHVFATGKAGFENFSIDAQSPSAGFTSNIGLSNGTTDFALYPGAGIEAFAGPIGLRLEAGDDVYFDHGAHNNLRVSVGPQFRF
jgi:hypothetical protein